VFIGCAGLEVLVVADRGVRRWRKRELLHIPYETQLVYHSELQLSLLLAELGTETTSEQRKKEICQEIRDRVKQMKK
jgi:hypothetical protein